MAGLSGFRIMWIQVIFDLPVVEKKKRKIATKFRKHLLDMGFEMVQYSVYQRFCASKEKAEVYIRRVEVEVPLRGKVHILLFTDKQYENIRIFESSKIAKKKKNPDQYELF